MSVKLWNPSVPRGSPHEAMDALARWYHRILKTKTVGPPTPETPDEDDKPDCERGWHAPHCRKYDPNKPARPPEGGS